MAALRLQYLHGDGAGRVGWSLGSVYPTGRLRNRILHSTKPGVGAAGGAGGRGSGGIGDGICTIGQGGAGTGTEKRKTPSFLDGTLRRSFKTGSLKKQKVSSRGGKWTQNFEDVFVNHVAPISFHCGGIRTVCEVLYESILC